MFTCLGITLIPIGIALIINIIYKREFLNYLIIILLMSIPIMYIYFDFGIDMSNYMTDYLLFSSGSKKFIINIIWLYGFWVFSISTIIYLYNKVTLKKVLIVLIYTLVLVLFEIINATIMYPLQWNVEITWIESILTYVFFGLLIFRPIYAVYTYAKESKDICINKYGKKPLIAKERFKIQKDDE